ncbi:MAG: hypothetical protein JNK78_17085 [Planctomycetes bacterium]|nr:hypothetical protein [Planctomycetota bacterium]
MTERRGLVATALFAVGAAAVVFACLPGAWPCPLRQGPVTSAAEVPEVVAAVRAAAAACTSGDAAAFAAATTRDHRERVTRQLAAVDATLDARSLRAIGAEGARVDWFAQPMWAGLVRGRRAVVALARPEGDGAQLMSFVWDGHRVLFDGARHAPNVRSSTAAQAAVQAAFERE